MVIPGVLATPAGCAHHCLGEEKVQPAYVSPGVGCMCVCHCTCNGACSAAHDCVLAPLSEGSNVTEHRKLQRSGSEVLVPLWEEYVSGVRSLSAAYLTSVTSAV